MNKLIAWILFTSIFAQDHIESHDTVHESSWIDSWLMPDPGLFLWTLVTFFIVLIILKAKAWGPLMDALDDREKRINDALTSNIFETSPMERSLRDIFKNTTPDPLRVVYIHKFTSVLITNYHDKNCSEYLIF